MKTPRTDAERRRLKKSKAYPPDPVSADFARTLERELAEYERTEPLKIDERNRLLAELNQAIKERDLLREGRLSDPLLKVTLEALTKERDDARECLREIVAGFVVCGCHRVRMYNHPPITENTLNRWCAGLEDA
jgi:hypothetical protein